MSATLIQSTTQSSNLNLTLLQEIREQIEKDPQLLEQSEVQDFCEYIESFSIQTTLTKKLSKDLKQAAINLEKEEARFLVSAYYLMQNDRIRFSNQLFSSREIEQTQEDGEIKMVKIKEKKPFHVLDHSFSQFSTLEQQIAKVLDLYSNSPNQPIGQWMRSQIGIGGVIASGFLAHIDFNICTTAGKLWRYAGIDPTCVWLSAEKSKQIVKDYFEKLNDNTKIKSSKVDYSDFAMICLQNNKIADNVEKFARNEKEEITKESLAKALSRRPFNSALKTLGYKTRESFRMFQNHKDCFYGKIYAQRFAWETMQNEAFAYKQQAEQILSEKNIGKETNAYKAYSIGKLPIAHIMSRAGRYALKIYLSHLQAVGFEYTFKQPAPIPYVIAYKGHQDFIKIPNYVSMIK